MVARCSYVGDTLIGSPNVVGPITISRKLLTSLGQLLEVCLGQSLATMPGRLLVLARVWGKP